ncbi:uncharacterized protein LOC126607777 isoform X2 [Malus sylvestris]|uniref:uncharacterized protein LOC126607777 isoform X2 n=1 Tax=Malus sylvestris TaxID=3752 RepID=UPI0021AD471A|nr:uncharacterized protein LOC126607777 isoform X2 [Malus sylvestris]
MILMFSTIICLREFVALVISEIEAFDCTRFPAIEVMETLDKAKCVVFIGSTMGGMKGWMVAMDLLLCGGSDSVMIPLGNAPILCKCYFLVLLRVARTVILFLCNYWRNGRLCGMQSTVTKKQ